MTSMAVRFWKPASLCNARHPCVIQSADQLLHARRRLEPELVVQSVTIRAVLVQRLRLVALREVHADQAAVGALSKLSGVHGGQARLDRRTEAPERSQPLANAL